MALSLASQSRNPLSETLLPGNTYPFREIRDNLQLQMDMITERRIQLIIQRDGESADWMHVLSTALPASPPRAKWREKKALKPEEDLTVFLRVVSAASSPAGYREEPLLILNPVFMAYIPAAVSPPPLAIALPKAANPWMRTCLAFKGARLTWDTILQIPKALKGAAPTARNQTLIPVPVVKASAPIVTDPPVLPLPNPPGTQGLPYVPDQLDPEADIPTPVVPVPVADTPSCRVPVLATALPPNWIRLRSRRHLLFRPRFLTVAPPPLMEGEELE